MKTHVTLSYVQNEKEVISAIAAADSEEKQKEDPLRVTRETWCYVVYDARLKPGPSPIIAPLSKPEVILVPSYFILNPNNSLPAISPASVHQPQDTRTTFSIGNSNPTPGAPRRRKQELTPSSSRSHTDSVPTIGVEEMRLRNQMNDNNSDSDKDNYDTKWFTKLRFKNADSVFHLPGYACPLCPDLKGMKVDSFGKHITYHKGRPYKCSVCGTFLTGSELELDKILKLKQEGVPEDHVCNKATTVPATFHPGSIWECGRCEETFKLAEERRAHEKEVHYLQEADIELPYECSWCSGNKFRDYVEWRLHRALEHPELARVACFHCDKLVAIKTKEGVDFEDNYGRIMHIKERHGPNARPPLSSQCFICGKVLNLEGELREHVTQEHGLGGDLPEPVQNALNVFQDRLADVEMEETPARRVIKPKKVDNSDNYDGRWATKVRFNKNDSALHTTGYTCPLCPDLTVMKLDSFVKHIIYHKGRPYKCSVCGIYLTGSETELAKIPKRTHKQEGVPEDHVCTKGTLIPAVFQPGDIWECGSCDETFCLEEERRALEKDAHGQNESSIKLPYECSWCSGSKFRDYVDWRLHRALEHPEQAKLACFYCDEIFSIKTKDIVDFEDTCGRIKHIKERHGPKVQRRFYHAECTMCGENFGQEIDLLNHMEQCHGILDRNQCRSCPICFSTYPRATNLKIHIKLVHYSSSKEKFICDVCGYENVNGLKFQQHKFMVHGIEPEDNRPIYSCTEPQCSFKCLVKLSLEVHKMKAHNAARPHKCQTCGNKFLTRGDLRRHQEIHTTNKPFQCEICGNSFAVKNYLYIHMRLSHQNRPFASTHRKRRSGSANKKATSQEIHGVDNPMPSMSHVSAITSGQYSHVPPETSTDYLS